jgi:alpha-beta hydrolase superfamily lysophospholipase
MENHLENLQMVIFSKWTKETTLLIKKIVKKNKIILIGSSMGAWISLNQFKFFKKQINRFFRNWFCT